MTPQTPLNNSATSSRDNPEAEARNATVIIQLLDEGVAMLDKTTVSKLAASRQQAVTAHVKSHARPAYSGNGLVQWLASYVHDHRTLMSTAALGCAVLMAFLVTQHLVSGDISEQGDASLLASDLPPEAYADKGFDIWLAQNSQR